MIRLIVILTLSVLSVSSISLAAPPAPVAQTGQTTCWDSAGVVISCAGTGQDGDRRAGVPWPVPRFTDNLNGTMTDNLTGLIWLKNLGCGELNDGYLDDWYILTDKVNSLHSGQCGLTDNSVAGQWRVPNKNELESLAVNSEVPQVGYYLNSQGFINAQYGSYLMSSSTHADVTSNTWMMKPDGHVFSYGGKSYNQLHTWAVR